MHVELHQRLHRLRDRGQDRNTDVLDEHVLGGGGPALHAVQHDRVGAGLDRQRHVVVGPRSADLDVDRDPPVGDLAELLDLDLEIVRPGPVRVPAGAALIDPLAVGPASRPPGLKSCARAASRRRPAWRPGRRRPRSRRRAAGHRGSCRNGKAATGTPTRKSALAPPGSSRRRRSSSTSPPRWRLGREPPSPAPTARRSSCRRS